MATTYLILQAISLEPLRSADPNDALGDWREYAQRDANSAADAIRKALGQHPAEGTFVAIPRRSFKPVKVTAVQTTNLKLEQP